MEIRHAVIGDLQLHYSFFGSNDCLIITTAPTGDGVMSQSWMLSWKPENGFRAERLREDPRYGIGTRDDVPLAAFPLAVAIAGIENDCQFIEKQDHLRILDLMHQAQAASCLKASP